jgi:hypothetical protein
MEARELFDICKELAHEEPSAKGLQRMHELLMLCCSEGTRHHGGAFGNLFSQVDFLCKQYGLSTAERVAIQTARRHTRQAGNEPLPSTEDWHYDLRALTNFVSATFKADVPHELRKLLPSIDRPLKKDFHVDRKYLRCIVRSWNDEVISVSTEEGELSVDYGSTDSGRDLSYLRRMLREDMQVNLLDSHVRESDGTLVPRFIIVEPDFLLDISSVAACFTNYGHHPLIYTVNRLKERPNTQAILLGNFAGTALDDLINDLKGATTAKSLKRSFREQALRFSTCQGFKAQQFKADAEMQVRNLRETVSELFEKEGFDRRKALLEPSFVCEQLGLQGRVDLMTSDLRLLVEQKSGRNMKIERQSHDPHGMQREDHYVQLLLYYGILRYNFGRTDQSVDIRLLYSRYPVSQGLLSVNYYRQLFAEALKVRNQIVATELLTAREGFGRIIPLLSPSIIYKDVKPDGYFNQYVLPDMLTMQKELAALSPVERAYYERMMTFVYREQVCQKLSTPDQWLQHNSGSSADLWQQPITLKQETGNIYARLSIVKQERSVSNGGYDRITLSTEPSDNDVKNFRRGDMIYLYAYHERRGAPDVRTSILYKGTLDEISNRQLVVRLNDGQQNDDIFQPRDGRFWAVEHGGSDLTTSSCLRSLHKFITAPAPLHGQRDKKALLLGQRQPEADTALHLSRTYSDTYDALIEKAMQARDYFLLVGPPGTGKTSQALRFIVAEELARGRGPEAAQASILLTAYTNRAVDEICAMLSSEDLPYLRIGNEAVCDPRFRSHLLEESLTGTLRLNDIREHISSAPIIVGTTSMLQSRQELFLLKHFTLAIVDEASQILEPNIIGLLAHPQIERFILVGDHKQLPAVVQQEASMTTIDEPCLRAIGLTDCRQSLFERLLNWERQCGRTQFIGTLDHQGRMHPEVAQFPCTHFYAHEQLKPVPLPHQLEERLAYDLPSEEPLDDVLKQQRIIFLDTKEQQEAALVAKLISRIYRFYGHHFNPDTTLGVIVPYRHQIGLIRQELEQYDTPCLFDVSIDTVERYQGSQRDVIIYSFTVSHRYQLDFLTASTISENGQTIDRKLNVAMTRARRQLIMTGRADLLSHVPLFKEIIDAYNIQHLSSF